MKSFNAPHKVGREGNETVLGKYTPHIDSVALLLDTKLFKFEHPEDDLLGITNSLEKATHKHEFLGHVMLTKKSSFWTYLFMHNFFSYMGFLQLLQISNSDFYKTEEGQKQLKKFTMDLIVSNEIYYRACKMWVPLQETVANAYLLTLKKSTEDTELKNNIDMLIMANKSEVKIIRDLTKLSEFILDRLGLEKGWQLLSGMALYASSIGTYRPKEEPINFEDLKKLKIQTFKDSMKNHSKDRALNDPTARFIEMIEVAVDCIDKVKRALFLRDIDPKNMALRIANMCGHEVGLIEDQMDYFNERFNALATNEKLMPDKVRRAVHTQAEKYMEIFKEITKLDFPTFWFITDKNSGKIYASKHGVTNRHNRNLENFMHLNILKYQFLKSIKNNKDVVNCFENKTSFCPSNCESCEWYLGLKMTKKLYQIMKDFSYEKLMKEAMNPERLKSAMFGQ